MKNLKLLGGAEADVVQAVLYLEEKRPRLGARFAESVARSLELLSSNPSLGSPLSADYRKLRVRGFQYSLIYRVHQEEVLVVAAAHHRRKPDYWLGRG